MSENNNFILAGNGPYLNRGCEAIVRGTMHIIRTASPGAKFKAFSYFPSSKELHAQSKLETDADIRHFSMGISRFSPVWWRRQIRRTFCLPLDPNAAFCDLMQNLQGSRAVLSVGGDNYSLDYGVPKSFTDMDDAVISAGKPLIIWGASIGPFSASPGFEKFMAAHLKRVRAIFARETATVKYLASIGVTNNVFLMADPAFLMDPVPPMDGFVPEKSSIGINLSPLLSKYVTCGDMEKWVPLAAQIVSAVARKFPRQIYLLPHVIQPGNDDHEFLTDVKRLLPAGMQVEVISGHYSAAELKHIIAGMDVFVGARTHSTIAALSSNIPTLSLAYSLKARGLNTDIFGHSDYCLESSGLSSGSVLSGISCLLAKKDEIRGVLIASNEKSKQSAYNAGKHLFSLIN